MALSQLLLFLTLVVTSRAQGIAHTWWPVVSVIDELALLENDCGRHAALLLDDLQNITFWAVQMVDASGYIPPGILSGNINSLGHFDECLSVVTPNADMHGQYCLPSVHLKLPGAHINHSRLVQEALSQPNPASSAWQHIKSRGERWRAPRDVLRIAMCIPDSCSPQLVRNAMQKALTSYVFAPSKSTIRHMDHKLHLQFTVELPDAMCSTATDFRIPFRAPDIIFCVILAVLILLTISSTLYDLLATPSEGRNKTDMKTSKRLFLSFAARKHFVGLGKMEKAGDLDLNFLFGLRLASILLVMFCHKLGFTAAGPNKNPEFQEQSFSMLQYMPLLHADLVVDTFFFLAGFLVSVGLLKALENKNIRSISIIGPLYLFRYMRLTPAYLLTVFFYATILPRMASGPFWKATVFPEHEYCVRNWWTNALYLNNYINVDSMCIEQSWYMPCDMHFFIVSVPLVMLLQRRPRLGWTLFSLVTIGTIIAQFLTIYILDTDAMLLFFFDFLRSSRMHKYFTSLYVKSHLRATPYFVGIFFGWTFRKLGENKIRKHQAYTLVFTSVVGCTTIALTGILFYDTDGMNSISTLARAFYGALHRSSWAVALGLFVVGVTAGRIGSVKAVLSWRPIVVLSKLSYGAYLIHIVVLWYSAGLVRDPTYSDSVLVVLHSLGDSVATFILALLLYLIVEAPIKDMTKVLLNIVAKKAKEKNKGNENGVTNTQKFTSEA